MIDVVYYGTMKRNAFFLCVALMAALLPSPARAHPGSGIVIGPDGQVYFIDTGSGLWKVDLRGNLVKITAPRFHWLALDAQNLFARSRLPSGSGGDITRVGSSPSLLVASDYPIAVGGDGILYYPTHRPGGATVDLLKVQPAGATSVLATIPLPYLNALAVAPDGSLLYTENRAIHRVNSRGQLSVVAANVAPSTCPKVPGNDPNDPLLRGLAQDSVGNIYVAASGCGSVLRVAPNGRISTILQIEAPWSPTAVALHHGDIFVLEYLHTDVEDRLLWLPRVRKISADGKQSIIASVTPAARAGGR